MADNCDSGNLNGFDSVYCFAKVYIGEDNRLNANYKELRGFLSNSQKTTLRDAQRSWIEKRNRQCMTGPSTVNVNCVLDITQSRADFLKARSTECKSVGCASSKLSQY